MALRVSALVAGVFAALYFGPYIADAVGGLYEELDPFFVILPVAFVLTVLIGATSALLIGRWRGLAGFRLALGMALSAGSAMVIAVAMVSAANALPLPDFFVTRAGDVLLTGLMAIVMVGAVWGIVAMLLRGTHETHLLQPDASWLGR